MENPDDQLAEYMQNEGWSPDSREAMEQFLNHPTRDSETVMGALAIASAARDEIDERKSMARKLGEEAGTKMLFPMILMLGAVMLILAFQAMRSMEL